jgi:lysyl-tRNA synthetase class I
MLHYNCIMDSMITNTLAEARIKTDSHNPVVGVGIRPSGEIHLGNIVTMATAAILARELHGSLDLVICDLDLPSYTEGKIVQPFKYQEDINGCHENVSEHYSTFINSFSKELARILDLGLNIRYLSDIQAQQGFRETLKTVLDQKEEFRKIIGRTNDRDYKVPVRPVCQECGFISKKLPVYNINTGYIKTKCKNDDCITHEIKVDVLDTDQVLTVHHIVDPIKDVSTDPKVDIHIFGGDYHIPSNGNKRSKLWQIEDLFKLTGQSVPVLFSTLTVYGNNGKRMSKSNRNGLSFSTLQQLYEGNLALKVMEFTDGLLSKEYHHAPFPICKDFFEHNID